MFVAFLLFCFFFFPFSQLNPDFHILPSVASFKFNYKKFLISGYEIYFSRLALYGYFCVSLTISAVKLFRWKRG